MNMYLAAIIFTVLGYCGTSIPEYKRLAALAAYSDVFFFSFFLNTHYTCAAHISMGIVEASVFAMLEHMLIFGSRIAMMYAAGIPARP